jgi:hypothetical protein
VKRAGAALLLVLLAGCWETLPKVVEVPRPVACVSDKPARPPLPTQAQLDAANGYQFVMLLEQHRLVAGAYIGELEAVVDGCARLPAAR